MGPQGCSERSPQFFHHCCRHHHHGGGVASKRSQKDSVRQMQNVCVGEEEKERWRRESRTRHKATVWGAVSLVDD